jgi:hypothetical protein
MKKNKLNIKLGRPITCGVCKSKFHKTTKKERIEWQDNKLICPNCGTKYSCLPKQERQLMELQDEYFETKNNDIIGKMYEILCPYAKSLAYKRFRSIMNEEYHEEFAHEASILLLQGYYKYADFRITVSFGAYLKRRFLQIPIDELKKNVSLNDLNEENKEYFQLESQIDLAKDDEVYLKRELLLNDIIKYIKNYNTRSPQIKLYSIMSFLYTLQNNTLSTLLPKNEEYAKAHNLFMAGLKGYLVSND